MPDNPDYPCTTSWFIKASTGLVQSSEGSGLAIRLRRTGEPGTERTYLLTCAHVIRRGGSDSNQFGPAHQTIHAWRAGVGFDPDRGIQLSPEADVTPLATQMKDTFYSHPVNNVANADWALLRFNDPSHANVTDLIVRMWPNVEVQVGNQCILCGYPGGASGFEGYENGNTNTVRPAHPYDERPVTSVNNGIIQFQGNDARAGMSGGGVFQSDAAGYIFVGIHRARYDAGLQLHAVSARHILARLTELGFEWVCPAPGPKPTLLPDPIPAPPATGPKTPTGIFWIGIIVVLLVLSTIVLVIWRPAWLFSPPVPRFAEHKKAVPTDLPAGLLAAFTELEKRYGSNVYLLVTEPVEKSSPSRFWLSSTQVGDQLEVRGIIETADASKGELRVDPAGKASEAINFWPESGVLRKGDRLQLLVGASHGVGHEEYLKSIQLERQK